MSTFLLVPGGGCDPSYWRFVVRELAVRGHRGVAVDLPCADDSADLDVYADVVATYAHGDGEPRVVVAHSFGGFTGALACPRVGAAELIYVSAMVPRPGECPGDWWSATGCVAAQREAAAAGGYDIADAVALYYNGVDPAVVGEEIERAQSETPSLKPWPAEALPQIPTRFILFRDDRFFPERFMRGVVADRLGIEPEVMSGGHMAMLSHPVELVDLLARSCGSSRAAGGCNGD
ncbi:alpha/beta fold hydrolase [Mycolicibacterium phocaicum]|uniref:alpha/beta fold hydrolase n=1 Tax=Mycolicibacterium phocaicum TaxID=319706 RepID=UPI001CFAB779|nr:alpha/beta hydrolase [Mycolicibacterium phocaicum]UCZ58060.1 alpha/beta hydrolase [Mycolicibacterium phocaicum]